MPFPLSPDQIDAVRDYRERLLADPYRPRYHFAIPGDDGHPGDPNGAFYARGRYHLMYLYHNGKTNGYHWGHLSSADLLHWRAHPDALVPAPGQRGYYSGGAFVDDDETAYLIYTDLPSRAHPLDEPGGIALAYARPPYDDWQTIEPQAVRGVPVGDPATSHNGFTLREIDGETRHVACADPSNIWKRDGVYYFQAGNKPVLMYMLYGTGKPVPPFYSGDWTDLFRSTDLKNWDYAGRFYQNPHTDPTWPDGMEDAMCPSFLPLFDAPCNGKPTGKWLQLFISHTRGCQYYVGRLEGETFVPEQHGRMSWKDTAYFAPEALIDGQNRQIVWAWLRDNLEDDFEQYGWSGVFSFPRVVWWQDGALHMAPAQELDRLQYNPQHFSNLPDGRVPVGDGASFRLKGVWRSPAEKAGVRVRANRAGTAYTDIYFDPQAGALVMDTTRSGGVGWRVKEEAPFSLAPGEPLHLDVFVDQSVVEVYANERQAICRRVYPTDAADAGNVVLLGEQPEGIDVWEMDSAGLY